MATITVYAGLRTPKMATLRACIIARLVTVIFSTTHPFAFGPNRYPMGACPVSLM